MILRTPVLLPYRLPFRAPFLTAQGRLEAREGWLLLLHTADGRTGLGEAAPLPGFTPETPHQAGEVLATALPRLTGQTLPEPAQLHLHEPEALFLALGLADWARDCPTARHALECAMLDLLAQAAGLPLADLLLAADGASAPRAVPVNATLGDADVAETVAQAKAAAAQGFGTLKLKVGRDPVQDAARLEALHRALPSGVRLRLDANAGWTLPQARRLLEDWSARGLLARVDYLEQPLPAADLAGMATLRAAGLVPLAADESVTSETTARQVLDADAAQVLVLKPMALGGLLPTLRIARLAAARGRRVVVTTMLEGAVGRTAALHAAAACQGLPDAPGPALACGLATGALLAADHALEAAPPVPRKGQLALPAGTGLGLRPRSDMLAGGGKIK